MKILRLEASNIKRVRVVEINPDGSLVLVTGRNAQGKSSVLDAIVYALGGKEAIPDKPLRDGADVGFIRLDLGDMVVERTFTADNTYLKVKAADTNAEYPTPQKLLDGLVGKIAFDPLAFARMKARDQLGALLEVVDLGLNLDALAAERTALFDNRTDVNREAKRLEGAIAKLPPWNEDNVPDEPLSAADLTSQLEELNAKGTKAVQAAAKSKELFVEIKELRAKLKRLETEYESLQEDYQNVGLWDDEIAALRAQVANADEVNNLVRVKKQYFELEGQLQGARFAGDELTAQIQAIDDRKTTALASATFPVPGLSFNDEGVLYDGRPLEQASSAELTRISTAIAMAANPKLQVILIHDGSLLDDDNLSVIAEMAAANGYQIWIEKVDESGEVGVVIEDGIVVNAAVPAAVAGKK